MTLQLRNIHKYKYEQLISIKDLFVIKGKGFQILYKTIYKNHFLTPEKIPQ